MGLITLLSACPWEMGAERAWRGHLALHTVAGVWSGLGWRQADILRGPPIQE